MPRWLLLLALVLWPLRALADEERPPQAPAAPAPASVESVAAEVLAAVAAGDGTKLTWLASPYVPDPWLVADELVRRGEHAAAEAFAKAAPRPDVEALPAYVAGRRGKADDPARRERLAASNAALQAKRFEEMLEALPAAEGGGMDDVTGVRLGAGRAFALANLGRWKEASAAFRAAAEAAEALGWLTRAIEYFDSAARLALDAGLPEDALSALERQLALASRRGDRRGEAIAHSWMGVAHARRDDPKSTVLAQERAAAAWDASGEPHAAAAARMELGAGLGSLGDHVRAAAVFEQAAQGFQAVGDRAGAAAALQQLGLAQALGGEAAKALGTWERARALYEALGDVSGQCGALVSQGRALSEGAQRDDAKALAAFGMALLLAQTHGDRPSEELVAGHLAKLHALRCERVEAQRLFERQIELREQAGDERELAAALIDAGGRFTAGVMRDASVALPWLERGLPLAEAAGEMRWVANAHTHVGDLQRESGRAPEALAAYERALRAASAAGDASTVAGAHVGIGDVHLQQGDGEAALAAYQRALALLESSGNRLGQAAVLEQVGKSHLARGSPSEAVAAYQRALDIATAEGNVHQTSWLLSGLAGVQVGSGDASKAVATFRRALALADERDDRPSAAKALLGLGVAERLLGNFARSLEATERAHALQLELGDRQGAAMTLCNLGVVYWDLGQVEKGRQLYEQALAEHRAVGDRDSTATTLGNLGATHERLGDSAQALVLLEESLALWQELRDVAGVARTRLNIARSHASLGDLPRALAQTEQALAELEGVGDKRGVAVAQVRRGTVLAKMGRAPQAIQAFERGARAAEKLGATSLLVEALKELAQVRLDGGDAGRALSEAHRAVELMKTLVSGLSEEQGASARGEHTDLFATGLKAAARLEDVGEAAFFLESGRAGALLEALGVREALRWTGIPEHLKQAESEARAEEARAHAAWAAVADGPDKVATRARAAELEAARARVSQAIERIQRESKKESRLAYPVATPMEEIQALLGVGEALALYGLTKEAEPAYALLLTRGEARIVELGPTAEVLEACEALHANQPGADVAAALQRLRAVLLAPLALPEGTRRLLISPDGALGYVPFAALAPDLELAYVASGTTYGVLREEQGAPGTKVLALGDPDYEATFDPAALDLYGPRSAPAAPAAEAPTRGRKLAPLPGTRAEVLAIGDVKLLGKDASEAGLLGALEAQEGPWRAVHFACHGLVDPDRPNRSSLALTPEGTNDGFLTVLEVLRMDLKADLVVLSACETARGKIAGGEGIVGLTRAFMFAGSPRVVCSLWKVDDEATAALMKKFYEIWNPKDGTPGLGTAQALREAQAFVRAQEKWSHPYYWAAWVLWGLP